MACYREFPVSTVVYNAITLGGAGVAGAIVAAQFGPWALGGYVLLVTIAGVGVVATVCARCGYYGQRCGLGLGRVVPLLFARGPEEEFFRTAPQFVTTLLLVVALLLPIAGGVYLLVERYTTWRLVQLIALVGLLLAGLAPHPGLVCRHCCQGARGACPVGQRLWQAGE